MENKIETTMQGLGLALGFKPWGLLFRVQGLRFKASGLWLRD